MKIRISPFVLSFVIIMSLSSCDAYLTLIYRVKNSTHQPIKLKVVSYSRDWGRDHRDTVFILVPGESFLLGESFPHVGFPGDERLIFKEQPGLQNFFLMNGDSVIQIDNQDKYWTYYSGLSTFKIRKKHLVVKR